MTQHHFVLLYPSKLQYVNRTRWATGHQPSLAGPLHACWASLKQQRLHAMHRPAASNGPIYPPYCPARPAARRQCRRCRCSALRRPCAARPPCRWACAATSWRGASTFLRVRGFVAGLVHSTVSGLHFAAMRTCRHRRMLPLWQHGKHAAAMARPPCTPTELPHLHPLCCAGRPFRRRRAGGGCLQRGQGHVAGLPGQRRLPASPGALPQVRAGVRHCGAAILQPAETLQGCSGVLAGPSRLPGRGAPASSHPAHVLPLSCVARPLPQRGAAQRGLPG